MLPITNACKGFCVFFDFASGNGTLTLKLLKLTPPYTIAIDRTEWQLGKSWVNVLMLSVSYKQVAIPLFWTVLETKGCCDDAEKQAIIEQFLAEFPAASIRFVTADREFASVKWLKYLVDRQIGFWLRIKANVRITDKRGKLVRASKMCRTLKTGQRMEFRRCRKLWTCPTPIYWFCLDFGAHGKLIIKWLNECQ
ncbi:MAG: transposase [Pyrinomonadaceae bacterium]